MRRTARWLSVHAVVVGVGWMPLVFAFFAIHGTEPGAGPVPDWVLGAVFLVAAVVVVPLLWPVLIAVAWYEGGLAERLATGDRSAARRAAQVLRGIGLCFAALAVVAGLGAWLARDDGSFHEEAVDWAWTGPAVVAAVHLRLARGPARAAAGPARAATRTTTGG